MDSTRTTRSTRRRRTWAAVGLAAAAALALTACSDDRATTGTGETTGTRSTASPPADLAAGQVAPDGPTTEVVTGLEAPWSVVPVGDEGDAFVSERDSARVLELQADGSTREVGTIEGVRHGGEGGLLGLALHDDDLFVYSTGDDGNRIERYDLTGETGSYRLGEATTVIDGLPANTFHDGGRIAFGPDDMLYASVGDAGNRSEAQDRDQLVKLV